ncbi:MAG: beta-propeller domain-containing protein, partial [Candidatus Woesearchaeota archaeon]
KVEEAITQYELKREEELKRTIIHKIQIKDGNLKYIAKGEVKGYLLNQFSMDEHNENLRVATTFDAWTSGKSITYNNIYVLNKDMKVIGKLEKIAPDERIYSTRFLGDRLYMVTFQRIDPFFVIDLSNPEKPEILGELKIPGFSDYLHPYDENTIIGLGKDTKENEWNTISTNGIKLALFDVKDVNNPKLIDQYIIGKEGTDSEALYNHKAFLFSKNKNLLVIPVRETKGKEVFDSRWGYRQKVWQGAYVFDISKQGFKLKGKVSHAETEEYPYWYYGSPNAIKRSLFMDDVLYTISQKKIEMNNLDDLETINSITLPYSEVYYPNPYKGGVAIE